MTDSVTNAKNKAQSLITITIEQRVAMLRDTPQFAQIESILNAFADDPYNKTWGENFTFSDTGDFEAHFEIPGLDNFLCDEELQHDDLVESCLNEMNSDLMYFKNLGTWTAVNFLGPVTIFNADNYQGRYAIFNQDLDLQIDTVKSEVHGFALIEQAMQNAGQFDSIVSTDYNGCFVKFLDIPCEIREAGENGTIYELVEWLEREDFTDLQRAVIEQMGYDPDAPCLELEQSLENICNHGASGGVNGFIYYSETCEFFDKNKTEIMSFAEDMADQLGEDMLTMIAGFNHIKDQELTPTEIMAAIYEKDSEHETTVKNILVWFALEETARTLVEA